MIAGLVVLQNPEMKGEGTERVEGTVRPHYFNLRSGAENRLYWNGSMHSSIPSASQEPIDVRDEACSVFLGMTNVVRRTCKRV